MAHPPNEIYNAAFMNADLSHYLTAAEGSDVSAGTYPAEFLAIPRPASVPAWHLVGGKDPLDPADLDGTEPEDGYPALLRDWIRHDGLRCLKLKLAVHPGLYSRRAGALDLSTLSGPGFGDHAASIQRSLPSPDGSL